MIPKWCPMLCPGFQSQGRFPCLHALSPTHKRFLRFTYGANPCWALGSQYFRWAVSSTYLHTKFGEARVQDQACLYLLACDKTDALPTELRWLVNQSHQLRFCHNSIVVNVMVVVNSRFYCITQTYLPFGLNLFDTVWMLRLCSTLVHMIPIAFEQFIRHNNPCNKRALVFIPSDYFICRCAIRPVPPVSLTDSINIGVGA